MFPKVARLSDITADHIFGDNHPAIFLYASNFSALNEKE